MSSDGHGSSGLPFLGWVEGLLHGAHDGGGLHMPVKTIIWASVICAIAFTIIAPYQTLRNISFVLFLAPLWIPVILTRFAVARWVEANRVEWLTKQNFVLLELRIPRDIHKSPLAMETIFTNMHLSPGESSWWKKYVNGSVRPWWSLEIVSLGGRVHFYLWTRDGYRRGIESYIYAQYPEIEIIEAADYSLLTDPSHHPYGMWGCEYGFTKKDVHPIRTYVEFMKPDAPLNKPEETIDSLAQVIELLGSIDPKEQFWLQIIIRVSKGEKYHGQKTSDGKAYTLRDESHEEIEKVRKETARKNIFVDPVTGKERETEGFPNPTKGQSATMEAIDRKVSKQVFDVGIRSIYSAEEGHFQGTMIAHQIGLLKPFSSESLNGFKLANRWDAIFNDWPWEDRGGHHKAHLQHQLVDAYRRRAYFYEPYRLPWMVMNTEELATLYHVPSSSVTTPSLPRIQSSTSEGPSNLPT